MDYNLCEHCVDSFATSAVKKFDLKVSVIKNAEYYNKRNNRIKLKVNRKDEGV